MKEHSFPHNQAPLQTVKLRPHRWRLPPQNGTGTCEEWPGHEADGAKCVGFGKESFLAPCWLGSGTPAHQDAPWIQAQLLWQTLPERQRTTSPTGSRAEVTQGPQHPGRWTPGRGPEGK